MFFGLQRYYKSFFGNCDENHAKLLWPAAIALTLQGMEKLKLQTEFIQLNQLLKLAGWVETGAEANQVIGEGLVRVNGQIETRKRNKIYAGTKVEYQENAVLVGH